MKWKVECLFSHIVGSEDEARLAEVVIQYGQETDYKLSIESMMSKHTYLSAISS